MFNDPLIEKLAVSLNEIGIRFVPGTYEVETVLRGILAQSSMLITDKLKLPYPGEILHEADYLAVKSLRK